MAMAKRPDATQRAEPRLAVGGFSGSLNKQQFIPSLIACLIHVQSRLSSCSISSKLTSSPGTGPVEDPFFGNYSVILHSSFALEH